MSDKHRILVPEVVAPRSRRLAAAAVAAALGGAVGSMAAGLAAWHLLEDDRAPLAAVAPATPEPPVIDRPDVAVEPAAPPAPLRGRAAFIIHGRGPMVSLADAPAEWQRGTPELIDADDFAQTLERRISDAVPASYRALVGSRIVAVDDKGGRCDVGVGALSIIGSYYAEDGEPRTAAERVEAWDYITPTLAAELVVPEHCGELAWAVIPGGGDGALQTRAVDRDPALAGTIRDRFRALDGYKRIGAEVSDFREGPWDDHATRITAVIEAPGGGVAVASALSYPCEPGGRLTALWRVRGGELGDPIAIPEDVTIEAIIGAADLNGDGLPEILYTSGLESGVLVSDGGRYTRVDGPQIQSYICPC